MDALLVLMSKSQAAIWAVTDVIAYTADFSAVLLLAQRFGGIAGWSKAELVFLFGFSTTAAGLRQMLFGYNVGAISRRIGRGQLDHSLVQPQPLALSLMTEGFNPVSGIYGVAPGAVLLIAGSIFTDIAVTPTFIAKLLICLVSSMATVLAASFAIGAAAFWAPRGAEEISMRAGSLLALTDFPLDPLPPALRGVLLTAIPAGFVAWFPASALLSRRSPSDWVFSPLVALVAALVAIAIFRKGLRHYARTGSSRYTTFGHRR